MKNIISILLFTCALALFTACNEDETIHQVEESNKTNFNPPSWIQGKWGYIKDDAPYEFRFTNDNFFTNSGTELDYNKMINTANLGTSKLSVEEVETDKTYKFYLKGGAITAEFGFKKVDDKTILHISNGTDLEMYKK
ncbi:hypothetical protein OBJ99_08625 [Empedobacter falsenii]